MSKIQMQGTWVGEYEMPKSSEGPAYSVPFTMDLKDGFFGAFSGTVRDDPGIGMPEPGTIHGKIRGLQVEFTKQMPIAYVALSKGAIKLSVYLMEQGITVDERAIKHSPIYYLGRYITDQDTVAGKWRISAHMLRIPGTRMIMRFLSGCGDFWMKRRA
jgi:hypothetical protein